MTAIAWGRRTRAALAMVAAVAAFAACAPTAGAALPPIHHVFVIVLENESASTTFGPNPPAPYLATTMRAAGAYLPNYYGIGHASLDNYIAMISGQAPNPNTQADCGIYADMSNPGIDLTGQETGTGCVYPPDIPTVADQLTHSGLTWAAYEESMGADPTRETSVCGHPVLGTADNTEGATPLDQYATRHDPFMYFHTITDTAQCDSVVNLDQLQTALDDAANTPNYVFITPDLCSDGHDANCANSQLAGGFAGINGFLTHWVPKITGSPAFMKDGLLIVIFDEAGGGDSSSCCGELPGPTALSPGGTGPGGGDTGAVLLSPFIAPGTVSAVPYNHYSMLATVEDIFGLGRLGDAGGATPFGNDVFGHPQAPPSVVTISTTTTTTTSATTTASPVARPMTLPPACSVPKLPHAAHGRLPAAALLRALALVGGRARRAITFTAVRAAKLRVVARTSAGSHRGVASLFVVPCHSYRFALPSGHGTVTIHATLPAGSSTVSKSY